MNKEIVSNRRYFLKFCALATAGLFINPPKIGNFFQGNPGCAAPDSTRTGKVKICKFKTRNESKSLSYQINDDELSRLLAKNGVDCEDIRLSFFFQKQAIRIKEEDETILAVGLMSPHPDGSREATLSDYVGTADEEMREVDERKFKQLTGVERMNWIALYEVCKAIKHYKGTIQGEEIDDKDCEQFANKHYQEYKIIKKGADAQ